MKNKLKYLLILILVIMTAGCSGDYNLKINADLSIDENLKLTIDNEDNAYQKTLDIFEKNNIDNDKYDINISEGKVLIEYNDNFNSIEEYILNSKVYRQLFNKIEYNKNNNYIDLYINENIKNKNKYNEINGSNLSDFDNININITNPFKVILTNADSINNSEYKWVLTKGDINKKIQMEFKLDFNNFPYKPIIVGLLMFIIFFYLIYRLIKIYKTRQSI